MPRLRDVTRVDVKWHTGGGYTGAPVTDPEEAERLREWMESGPDAEIARLQAETADIRKGSAAIREKTKEYRAETARMAIEKYPEKEASILARMFPKEKPSEQFLSPLDPGFKAQFEQKVFGYLEKQYGIPGGNPHKMNIPDMVERISTQRLPQLWGSVTNNQVRWEDRDTIKENFPKIWKYWIQTITKDRSRINADLKTRQAGAIKDYEYEMGKVDTRIKTARENLKQQRQERLDALEPPKQRTIWNPTTKQMEIQEWDPALQKFADTGKVAKPPKEEKPEKETLAGERAKEKFAIQKATTAATVRTILTGSKDDKNAFQANAPLFNKVNRRNEIAYWETGVTDEEVKIIKLNPNAIGAGWTPERIQEAAFAKGITVEQVLKDLGIIK